MRPIPVRRAVRWHGLPLFARSCKLALCRRSTVASLVLLVGSVPLTMLCTTARGQQQQQATEPATVISTGNASSNLHPHSPGAKLRPRLPDEKWTGTADTAAAQPVPNTLPPFPTLDSAYANSAVVQASASRPQEQRSSPVHSAAGSKIKQRVPLAQPSTIADSASADSGSSGTLQMLMSIGSSLLIVLGLFLGLAWFYRKTLNVSMGGLPKQVVQVLGRTPIAARQQLVLVRFGSKLVLVSLVQGEARTISEINDPLEVDQLAGMCESAQPGSISSSFRSILNQGGATV